MEMALGRDGKTKGKKSCGHCYDNQAKRWQELELRLAMESWRKEHLRGT